MEMMYVLVVWSPEWGSTPGRWELADGTLYPEIDHVCGVKKAAEYRCPTRKYMVAEVRCPDRDIAE